jgi:ArsR family transcriptional regulator
MKQSVTLLKALADKNRIRILKMLEKKSLCVCEITAILGLAVSTTSNHLSKLKDAKLIFEQKEGNWVNYHLNKATQNKYAREALALIEAWLNEDDIIQKDLVKINQVNRIDLCKG